MNRELVKGICGLFGIVLLLLMSLYYGIAWHEHRINRLERRLRGVASEIKCFNAYTGEIEVFIKDYEDEYRTNRVLRRMLTASRAEIKALNALFGEKKIAKRIYPPKKEE